MRELQFLMTRSGRTMLQRNVVSRIVATAGLMIFSWVATVPTQVAALDHCQVDAPNWTCALWCTTGSTEVRVTGSHGGFGKTECPGIEDAQCNISLSTSCRDFGSTDTSGWGHCSRNELALSVVCFSWA